MKYLEARTLGSVAAMVLLLDSCMSARNQPADSTTTSSNGETIRSESKVRQEPSQNATMKTGALSILESEKCRVIEAISHDLLKLPLRAPNKPLGRVVASSRTVVAYLDDKPFSTDAARLAREFPGHEALLANFLELGKTSGQLRCENLAPSVIWVSEERLQLLWDFEAESWTKHISRLEPQAAGLGGFSDVGISSNGREAFAYAFLQYGDLGGEGKYWLVTKENDGWKVKQRADIWIS